MSGFWKWVNRLFSFLLKLKVSFEAGADPEVARQIKDFDYGTLSAEEIIPLMRLILPDFVRIF